MTRKRARVATASSTYYEKLSSARTELLFLTFTLLCFMLARRRTRAARRGILTSIFSGLSLFFLFYSLNYRMLIIRLTQEELVLHFGLFSWKIATDNIESCRLDETSLLRIGGAGIHFSWFQGRYRAMFNFLEYPRVVVRLRKERGPVQEVAFSTREPYRIMALIRESAAMDALPGD